jgi:hypothetical protein
MRPTGIDFVCAECLVDDEDSPSEYGSSIDDRPDLLPDLGNGGISGRSRSSSFSGNNGEAEDVRLWKGEVWRDGGVDSRLGEKIAGRKYMTPRDERVRRKLGEWGAPLYSGEPPK